MATRSHPYGSKIVGEAEAAEQRARKKSGRNIYGPKVTGDSPGTPRISGEAVTADDAAMSLKRLGELLAESPETLDRQIDAELQRADGARKGALRLFIEHETRREGGPRADVLGLLERALNGR